MNWSNFLFSFDGRINRAKIWLFILIIIVAYICFGIVFTVLFGASLFTLMFTVATNPAAMFTAGGAALGSIIAFCAFYLLVFYTGLAVSAKRLHDRNKGAIWLVWFIVLPAILNVARVAIWPIDLSAGAQTTNPAAIAMQLVAFGLSLWAFVELYCLRGTVGDNSYGPDPLAGKT
jgi:uncharacterized membrane protein YhaH (DUF805 family)